MRASHVTMRATSLSMIGIDDTTHHQSQHVMPLHQWGVLKHKQGCPTDRSLRGTDICLSGRRIK